MSEAGIPAVLGEDSPFGLGDAVAVFVQQVRG
jgi:hypothetical protein